MATRRALRGHWNLNVAASSLITLPSSESNGRLWFWVELSLLAECIGTQQMARDVTFWKVVSVKSSKMSGSNTGGSFWWILLESENPGESSIRRPWAHPAVTLRWFWPRDGAHGWCPIRMRCLRWSWAVGGKDLGVTGENITSCGCWNDLRVTSLNSLYGSFRVWRPKVTMQVLEFHHP